MVPEGQIAGFQNRQKVENQGRRPPENDRPQNTNFQGKYSPTLTVMI
jgi:hypothetical protein